MKYIEPIQVQGLFYWDGQEYKRLKKIGKLKFMRDRKLFYALNIPNVKKISERELANQIIIDFYLDEEMEAPYLITDPQKVDGGFMKPYSEQFQTNNPGMVVFVGFVRVPGYARYSTPETHNVRIKAAMRDKGSTERLFDADHGAVEARFTFDIVDDYKPD